MAENPELGVLFIEHGESLDLEKLKIIQSLAKKHDWQILMEEVRRDKDSLHIEIMPDDWDEYAKRDEEFDKKLDRIAPVKKEE